MKFIEAIKWEATKRAVVLVYADASTDLGTKVKGIDISSGSLAYLANGDVYVFNGTQWNKIGG